MPSKSNSLLYSFCVLILLLSLVNLHLSNQPPPDNNSANEVINQRGADDFWTAS